MYRSDAKKQSFGPETDVSSVDLQLQAYKSDGESDSDDDQWEDELVNIFKGTSINDHFLSIASDGRIDDGRISARSKSCNASYIMDQLDPKDKSKIQRLSSMHEGLNNNLNQTGFQNFRLTTHIEKQIKDTGQGLLRTAAPVLKKHGVEPKLAILLDASKSMKAIGPLGQEEIDKKRRAKADAEVAQIMGLQPYTNMSKRPRSSGELFSPNSVTYGVADFGGRVPRKTGNLAHDQDGSRLPDMMKLVVHSGKKSFDGNGNRYDVQSFGNSDSQSPTCSAMHSSKLTGGNGGTGNDSFVSIPNTGPVVEDTTMTDAPSSLQEPMIGFTGQ